MPKKLQINWSDAIHRWEYLEKGTAWLQYYADPVVRENMTDRGIGDHFGEWTQADKVAYSFLLEGQEALQAEDKAEFGDPEGVAKGFGLRYEVVDRVAAQLQSDRYRRDIEVAFIDLQNILGKFESLIRKRWGKKKAADRTKALETAWPNIPAWHRLDLRCTLGGHPQPRDVLLMPYINLEDLVQGNTLLRLLNSRGRHQPSVFAQVDLERLQLAIRSKEIQLKYQLAEQKIDMSSSVLKNGLYGYLSVHTIPDVIDVVIHREVAGCDGFLVLEVQARLLGFLKTLCRGILHDKPTEIDNDKVPHEPEPEPLPAHDQTTDSVVWVALQAPYRTPHAAIDLPAMVDLAKAAADDAQMRVRALRQDPGYFASAVMDFEQHSLEYIEDDYREHHYDVDRPGKYFVNKAVRSMVHEAVRVALLWEVVASLLEQVVGQERRFIESGIQLEEDSRGYFDLLLKLRNTLDNMMLPSTMLRLAVVVLTDPCYRPSLVRSEPWSTEKIMCKHEAWPEVGSDFLIGLVLGGYNYARGEGTLSRIARMEEVLVEIQRVMETEPERKSALSEYAVTTIAQAGLQADLRSQLTNFRPRVFAPSQGVGYERARAGKEGWANLSVQATTLAVTKLDSILGYETKVTTKKFDNNILAYNRKFLLKEAVDDSDDTKFPNLAEYSDPSNDKFKYPIRLTSTQETTKTMQKAEANLDIFWSKFDGALEEKDHGQGAWEEMQRISVPPKLDRTADWVEPLPRARGRAQQGAQLGSVGDIDSQLLQLSLSPRPGNKALLLQEASQKKEKEKRRGTADPLKATQAQEVEEPTNEPGPPARDVFRVDGRALAVVETLFHQPGVHSRRNNIAWKEFVRVMTSIGFAVSGLGGSMWRFTPTGDQLRQGLSGEETRSIIFHQPHPGSDLPFYIARGIGSKLTEKYKLDASSFQER